MEKAIQSSRSWLQFLEQLTPVNPVLASHLGQWQNASLSDYVGYIWQGLNRELSRTVSSSFLSALDLVNLEGINHLKQSLVGNPVVLSAHHTAPISHPIAFQILLLASAARSKPQVIPVLCTDWVPMDNLFYPRGVLLPTLNGLQRFNIFPKRSNKVCVSEMPGYTLADVDKLKVELARAYKNQLIDSERNDLYSTLVEKFFCSKNVLQQSLFKQQCSMLNSMLCKAIFPEQQFVFLNISDIAGRILVNELNDEASIIRWLLLDENARTYFVSLLDGEIGCWSIRQSRGSILFWQLTDGKMQALLQYSKQTLSNDTFKLMMSSEGLIDAIETKKIIPGMALVFSLLMVQCGLSCVGGMRQIAYNKAIVTALNKVVKRYRPDFTQPLNSTADAFVAGVYACINSAGQPAGITDVMLHPELLGSDYGSQSLQSAVLKAADSILSLSA